ncbi:recombinase family protein [Phenylobacterium sp.]|uniref:recombinase family protein n=1 Tax=Phenylobacterium sp. TaxID=1871053 RepID=UPI0012224687|nr:recombinase family protein [Phenylobacterium sp.]THD60327.1 MAG: hypothetical protein E8A12_10675 [Phenylobacterium sp.]
MSREHERYSIENQMPAVAAYARRRRYRIVSTYADEGVSGVGFKTRHGLKALLADAMGGAAVSGSMRETGHLGRRNCAADVRSEPEGDQIPLRRTPHLVVLGLLGRWGSSDAAVGCLKHGADDPHR